MTAKKHRSIVIWLIVFFIIGWCVCSIGASETVATSFRLGFSKTLFAGVNENDAMAAVKIWTQGLVTEQGIQADPYTKIFQSSTEMSQALTDKAVDAITVSMVEYLAIRNLVANDSVVISLVSGSITEEYVLLVHRDSGIQGISDLKGATLGLLQNGRTTLAPAWLDILLARENLSPATDFLKAMTSEPKVDKLVYQVFFRQTDACLATRSSFELMGELNPQVGQQLKVLATSPPVVPTVCCFRKNYTSPVLGEIKKELSNWHRSPAGRQILTLFQTDRVDEYPISSLDSTLKMLGEHTRLTDNAPSDVTKGGSE